ncbi:MAG: hypothetical protein QOD66_3218 [Solirubrobacteraceae bacterium]|nr:hypothetical protein [Solirubrobacteraceae bacterium]
MIDSRASSMTRHRLRAGFAALAMSAIGLMGLPTSAAAAGASVIVKVHQSSGLVSSYFQLKSHPGARVNAGFLLLLNPTSRTSIVRVDPVGAITTDTLGSAFALRGGRAHGPGAWLKLSPRQVRIAPRSQRRINVSVTTPRSAKPGDYLSGVAVEALGQDGRAARTARKRDLPHGVSIGEIYRYAIGVEVSLPGRRDPHVRFTGAGVDRDPAGMVLRIGARNDGNVILRNVTGHVTVTRNGRLVVRSRILPGTFVTDSSIQLAVPAYRQHPFAGTVYRVQASITYAGGSAHLDREVTFGNAAAKAQQNYGGPRASSHHGTAWVYIAPSALALVILLGFAWRTMRRLPRRAAALAFLHSELTASQPGGRPLTVIHLDVANASRASRRRTAHALRRTLRKSDRIYDLDRDGLLIALPRTGPATAGELGSEISDALRAQEVRFVGAPTSIDGIDPHELIAQAKTPPMPEAETASGAPSIRRPATTGSIASSQGAT